VFFLRFQDLLSWIHVVSHSSLGSKKIKYYTKDCLHTKNLTINTTLSYNIQYLLSCKICMNGELFWLLVLQVFNFWSWTQLLFITFFNVEKFQFFFILVIFCFVYDQKWRFLGGTFRVLEIRSLDGVGVGGPPKGLPRPLAPWVRKVGRSVISTSRRELGWILVLLQECYQFALWRPLAAAAAQVWTRYPLSGARTGTGSAPTGHFLFWSRYPLFQDGVLPQGIRISIPQLAEIVEFQFWCRLKRFSDV